LGRITESYAARAFTYILLSRDEEAQQDMMQAVELGFDPALLEREVAVLMKRGQEVIQTKGK
jgi:hypothetical protein